MGRVNGALSASYSINIDDDHRLSFGMSGMVIQNRIFFDRVEIDDDTDPNLLNNVNQQTAFDGNVGVSYLWKGLRIGFAADQIFQNEVNFENAAQFQALDFNYVRHYITSAEYKIPLRQNMSIRPLVLVRTVQGLPSQVDGNLIF
ncbi:MAG: type IX secretion system membrane protein PorP/SprF, partial [Bacteroidota bacterium]